LNDDGHDWGRRSGVAGVQEFRSSGVQEFRSSGVQEFRSSGVQEFRSSGRIMGASPKVKPDAGTLPFKLSSLPDSVTPELL
jgi:hypothetical protein